MCKHNWFAGLALAGLLGGCGGNFESIFRTANLEESSVVTDAKQRVIISTPASGSLGANQPRRIVCSEPSPDVASSISESLTAAVEAQNATGESIDASVATTFASSLVQLGERLATIQFLRDGLYKACEGYANGALTDVSYAMIMAGFDELFAGIFAMEMAAGEFGRTLASTQGTGSAATDPKVLDAARLKELQDKQLANSAAEVSKRQEIASLQTALSATRNDATLTDEQKAAKVREQEAAITKARNELEVIETEKGVLNGQIADVKAIALSASASSTGQAGGGLNGPSDQQSGEVTRIFQTYMGKSNLDSIVAACIVAMDRAPASTSPGGIGRTLRPETTMLAEVCKGIMTINVAGVDPKTGRELPPITQFGQSIQERSRLTMALARVKTQDVLYQAIASYAQHCTAPNANAKACAALEGLVDSVRKQLDAETALSAS